MHVIAAVLAVLWLLGLVCGFTPGGGIHILLVIAVIIFLGKRMGDGKRSQRSKEQAARSEQPRGDIGA